MKISTSSYALLLVFFEDEFRLRADNRQGSSGTVIKLWLFTKFLIVDFLECGSLNSFPLNRDRGASRGPPIKPKSHTEALPIALSEGGLHTLL